MTYKILGISGSLRKQSCNTGMLRAAQKQLPDNATMTIADLSDVPFYNADIKEKPASVTCILEQLSEADAIVFACPEYNYSTAPALKNIIDWVSRENPNPYFNDKPAALMGAGGGMGTSRSQYHLRQILVFVNVHPLNKPEVFANAFAGGFDADGNVTDEKIIQSIADQMKALVAWTERLKN